MESKENADSHTSLKIVSPVKIENNSDWNSKSELFVDQKVKAAKVLGVTRIKHKAKSKSSAKRFELRASEERTYKVQKKKLNQKH